MFGSYDPAAGADVGGAGITKRLHELVLEHYDRMIGLELEVVAVNGCITKASCGGQRAGPSPVDRGKQWIKCSMWWHYLRLSDLVHV